MQNSRDPDLVIRVGSPEGGSTITPEACADFMEGACPTTCHTIGTCALANAVARQLERAAASPVVGSPPSVAEVTRLMDLNEQN